MAKFRVVVSGAETPIVPGDTIDIPDGSKYVIFVVNDDTVYAVMAGDPAYLGRVTSTAFSRRTLVAESSLKDK